MLKVPENKERLINYIVMEVLILGIRIFGEKSIFWNFYSGIRVDYEITGGVQDWFRSSRGQDKEESLLTVFSKFLTIGTR